MKKNGAEIVVDFLKHHKIKVVFGYPGGAILPIYDELFKANIKHILVRHEQAAIHAAEGYAKASGNVGVVFVTSGPGATNIVTGLVDAKMDSVPLLVITGQVPTHLIGKNSFQEVNICKIVESITKYNNLVLNVNNLSSVLEEAYIRASSARPGPSLVDIPKDVQNAKTKHIDFVVNESVKKYYEKIFNIDGNLDALIKAINKAKRPLMYVGGGAILSRAELEIAQLAENGNIPLSMTLMALGIFPMGSPLSLDMMGMHGTYFSNLAVTQCDLLIALGARFDDRVTGKLETFAKQAKIAHIDIDRSEINKLAKADYPIQGDLKIVLKKIIPFIKYKARKPWFDYLNKLKKDHPLKYYYSDKEIKPQFFIEKLNKVTNSKAIICTEVGQHQMWAAQFYSYKKPRTWISSGGLGTMGFGFPAGIGAKLAYPEKDVFIISGDGSFQMNQQELATCSIYNINVKIVILNNTFLGMVRQWQEIFFDSRLSNTDFQMNPDFVKLAEAYNLKGMKISHPSEIDKGIKFLLESNKTAILDVIIPKNEMVFPMIPSGSSLDEIIEIDDVKNKFNLNNKH